MSYSSSGVSFRDPGTALGRRNDFFAAPYIVPESKPSLTNFQVTPRGLLSFANLLRWLRRWQICKSFDQKACNFRVMMIIFKKYLPRTDKSCHLTASTTFSRSMWTIKSLVTSWGRWRVSNRYFHGPFTFGLWVGKVWLKKTVDVEGVVLFSTLFQKFHNLARVRPKIDHKAIDV